MLRFQGNTVVPWFRACLLWMASLALMPVRFDQVYLPSRSLARSLARSGFPRVVSFNLALSAKKGRIETFQRTAR